MPISLIVAFFAVGSLAYFFSEIISFFKCYPSLVTPIVGLVAAYIALWSIHKQRQTARQKNSLDFVAHHRNEKRIIDARKGYIKAKKHLNSTYFVDICENGRAGLYFACFLTKYNFGSEIIVPSRSFHFGCNTVF